MNTKTKPTFDDFVLALLYDDRRTWLGIRLDVFDARQLIVDEPALVAYYSAWTPDFRPMPRRARPAFTRAQQRRAITATIAVILTAGALITAAVFAALLLYGFVIGGHDVPVIGG